MNYGKLVFRVFNFIHDTHFHMNLLYVVQGPPWSSGLRRQSLPQYILPFTARVVDSSLARSQKVMWKHFKFMCTYLWYQWSQVNANYYWAMMSHIYTQQPTIHSIKTPNLTIQWSVLIRQQHTILIVYIYNKY